MKPLDANSKVAGAGSKPSASPGRERRRSRRCKITQKIRVRPSNPEVKHFVEVRGTASVSRSGAYFETADRRYWLGMRLFATLPFSDSPAALNREYLAEVVRLDKLEDGQIGVGLKLLMELGYSVGSELSLLQSK